MTRAEVIALVALATGAHPAAQGKDPKPVVEAWSLMLADIPFVVAKAAVIKVCRESKFFPSVADIVEAAQELDPEKEKLPTAAEAWEEVVQLIIDYGPYCAPAYSCDLVRRAAQAIGWLQLCTGDNAEADRAHFLKIYESMRSRHKDQRENKKALELSGMGKVITSLTRKLAK